ncbi:MAG: TIGR03915 family putative DNA repair protein [Clostridiales bacterium]|jgi:probable DNA metabolism protein|nr:TIGR03915 family putative DNA repair protein [Clostridiales bacterium]
MSGFKIVTDHANVVYIYDGSLGGFYTCVHESIYSHELPAGIFCEEDDQLNIFPVKHIDTDIEKAGKVRASIFKYLSPDSVELIERVFLSCLCEKELNILKYIIFGFTEGGHNTPFMMGNPVVSVLLKADKHLSGECQLLLGFVRFSDYGDMLGAVITPKNYVLPFIASHFISRYSNENFIIYDKTNSAALVYQNKKAEILKVSDITFNEPDERELYYQGMWKSFYNTIGIKERVNPKCRMTHMPKRYWSNMTEMKELLN